MTALAIVLLVWVGANALAVAVLIVACQRADRRKARSAQALDRELRALISPHEL